MLLLIDAGNTRIKWALAGPAPVAADLGRWTASGAVLHDGIERLAHDWGTSPVTMVLIANVAGASVQAALVRQLEILQQERIAIDPEENAAPVIHWFASTAQVAGVHNRYRMAERLGCDRLAALIGARALLPDQALIVAVCGTATTIDALTASGDFIGGMILPGPALMAASLARHTAQLPAVAAITAVTGQIAVATGMRLFADNTEDAITSGCLAAQAGAIERAVAEHDGAHCLLSGGAAHLVAPRLRAAATLVDNLVLIGLQVVAGSARQPARTEQR